MSATHAQQPAAGPVLRGLEIFQQADALSSGYVDLEVDLEMILRTPNGSETRRELRIKQFEVPNDGDKVLVVFDTPADIRGTALLSHTHKVKDDDQWLYLPAVERVKKITSRNKSGSFVGSEFSFEDLALPELEKYNYRFISNDEVEGVPCFVVERTPASLVSGYERVVFWLDHEAHRIRRVEYFDKQPDPVKQLTVDGYNLYEGKFWKAQRMVMENLRTGKSTELQWRNYQFGVGLSEQRDFSVTGLRRVR